MARIDKSSPITGSFRAHIAADYPDANLHKLYGVGLDSAGKVVIGAGVDGIVGVMVLNEKPGMVGPLRQVSRIDVLQRGEVVEFGPTTGVPGTDFGTAGHAYYAAANGNISDTWAAGSTYVGHCVEPDRLVVNVNVIPAAAGL